MMITKTFTAGLLALSLSIASVVPTTASAELSDRDKVVGLLTLFLLGAAIHDSRDNSPRSDPRPVQPPRGGDHWRVLPEQCLVRVQSRRGETVRMFGQRCLNNNYRFVNRLPQSCAVTVRSQNGHLRRGYNPRCLRNAGFRINRH